MFNDQTTKEQRMGEKVTIREMLGYVGVIIGALVLTFLILCL